MGSETVQYRVLVTVTAIEAGQQPRAESYWLPSRFLTRVAADAEASAAHERLAEGWAVVTTATVEALADGSWSLVRLLVHPAELGREALGVMRVPVQTMDECQGGKR